MIAHFRLVPLAVEDYRESLRALAAAGWAGGLIYDGLLLRAADKSVAEQEFTFNASHFQRLARNPELGARIGAP